MGSIKISGAFASRRLDAMSPQDRAAMVRRANEKISSVSGLESTMANVDTAAQAQDRLQSYVDETKASLMDSPYTAASLGSSDSRFIGKYSRVAESSRDTGVLLMRRPTQAEIEMGALGDDIIFLPPSAGSSPFPSPKPVGFSLLGGEQAGAGVSQEEVDTQTSVPLYGDLNDVLNRLVDGAHKGVSYIKSKIDTDKWSPKTKLALGVAGTAATVYGINKLTPNTMYFQLGRMSKGDGFSDGDDGETQRVGFFTPSSVAERAVSSSSRSIGREAEMEALGRTIYPVANNFMAGAYALGKSFNSRRNQPSFGMLGGDPSVSWKAARGLRAPRFYWDGERILRTSAPYAGRILPSMDPVTISRWLSDHPLAGGVFKDLASSVMDRMGDVVQGVLGKVKEWAKSLVSRLKGALKKIFSKHTNYPARHYSVSVTPAYLAAQYWSMLGQIPSSTVDSWYNQMESDVKRIASNHKWNDKPDETDQMAINSILGDMEKVRLQAGIPSQVPWTESPALEVIQQYAPQTAKHFAALKDAKSNDWMDAFGTRNPVVVFADPAAMESDMKLAQSELQSEIENRRAQESAASGGGTVMSVSATSPTVPTVVSAGSSTPQITGTSNPYPQAESSLSMPSDPTVLAQQIVMESGGSAHEIPRAWLDQLPLNVKKELGMASGSEEHFDTLIGEPLVPWSTGSSQKVPMSGSPALIPMIRTAFKSWILPTLMALIPWKKVSAWFSKNAAKAKLLLKGSGTSSVASNAAKSTGFVAALPNALRTIARKSGSVAKAVMGFCARNPKLAGLTALLGACFIMGSSYTTDTKTLSALLDLLRKALKELSGIGAISDDDATAHEEALEVINKNGFANLTEKEAQELQTVAVLCYVTSSYLESTNSLTADRYPALCELREVIDNAANDMKANATSEELTDLETFAVKVVEEVAMEQAATSAKPGARGNTVTATSSADPTLAMAVAAAGGELAARDEEAPSTAIPDVQAPVSAVGTATAESAASHDLAEASTSAALSANLALDEAALDNLTPSQMEELTTLVDASQTMSEQDLMMEESGSTSRLLDAAKELCVKWGLPIALASSIVALVIAAVRARRRGSSGDNTEGWLAKVSSWWSNVTGSADPSLGSSLGDDVTGVAL